MRNSNMFKRLLLLVAILITVQSCAHRQKLTPPPPEQIKHIFYTEQKPEAFYRKSITPFQKPSFISIAAVGDIFIGNHVIYYLKKHGTGYPFDSTKAVLTAADLAIGNLEAPFATKGKKFDKKFNFKIHPKYATGLPDAGFDVLNLANNHTMDYGVEALVSTLNTLDSLGLKYSGAGLNKEQALRPAIMEHNGIKVAFIGCSLTFPAEFWATEDSAGTFYPQETELVNMIKYCEGVADFTVITFHWGAESRITPKPYQRDYAHLSIDAGADLIIGHHPHVLQGVELYRNRLIFYSLGNFAFGSYTKKARDAAILKAYLTTSGLLYARVIPISVYNYEVSFQPRILKRKQANRVISHLKEISLHLNKNENIITDEGIIWGDWSIIHEPRKFAITE
ncbi:CapA family protein [candidate division KSB1 bacterium]|nr:CapA family protein [candidate division KSB1 bacterium]